MFFKNILLIYIMVCMFGLAHAEEDIVLLFGGDVTLSNNYPVIATGAYVDPNYSFRKISDITKESDVFVVNCENAITNYTKKIAKKFNFKMDPQLTGVFSKNQINLVNLANNHVLDYDTRGLSDTIKYLNIFGVKHFGAGMNLQEARSPVVENVKGKKLFFFGYGNGYRAGEKTAGVAYLDQKMVIEDIKNAKEMGADIIIVNFHWGKERTSFPLREQKELAKAAIDSGADIIIGHHPHVIQPIEVYKGKVIAYSLGNFIFGGNKNGPKEGLLVKIIIKPDGSIQFQKIILEVNAKITKYQPFVKEQK